MWQQFRNFFLDKVNKSFGEYYIDDYIADKNENLSKNKEDIYIHINFKFKKILLILEIDSFLRIPNIFVSQNLRLHNPKQFIAVLNHYIPSSSGRYKRVKKEDISPYNSKYKDLYGEIERRNIFQIDIDGKINALSKYLNINLKDNQDIKIINITYSNLNSSILTLAINHLQYIMLSLRTGSYLTSTIDEIDGFMIKVLRECNKKSFHIHYVDNLGKQSNLPVNKFNIKFNFGFQDENKELFKHTLRKIFRIKNADQFRALLNYYNGCGFEKFTPLKSSYNKYIGDYIIYYNTFQVCIDKVLGKLNRLLFSCSIEADKNNPLILNINYDYLNQTRLLLAIRHFELLIATFKIGNDNTDDRNATDRLLLNLRKDIYLLVKDNTFRSFYKYYTNNLSRIREGITPSTFKLNLSIVLGECQYNFTNTFHLQQSELFKNLLDFFNFLPNGYLPFINSFMEYIEVHQDLFYIFNQDKNDPSILNLYYYPLNNKFDISLIIDHLTIMVRIFKKEINFNFIDNNTLDQYLTSIIKELTSFGIQSVNKTNNLINSSIFSISKFAISSIENSTSFQKYLVTQYNNRSNTSVSNITINLRLLLKDSQSLSNTYKLALTNTDQLLSLLNHYSLSKDPLDPSWMEGYRERAELYEEISRRGKLQTSLDGSLSRLPKDISLNLKEDDSNPYNVEVGYPNLELSSVPYAMKHLELMMLVYKAGNYSPNDKLEVDGFVFQVREDVEGGYSSISKLDNKHPTSIPISPILKPSTSAIKSSIIKPSVRPSTSKSFLKPLAFGQTGNPSDKRTILPSSLTLNLRFLPFDNLILEDTLRFQDTSRFLSILHHYDLKPDNFNHPDTNDFKVSSRVRIQKDIDNTLLGLYDRIHFHFGKVSDDSILYLTYSKLGPTDVPSALLHLDLMVRVFRIGSYDKEGKRVLDDFVNKARRVIVPIIPVASSRDNDWNDGDDKNDIDDDDPRRVSPADGRLGGAASIDVPNLLEVTGDDISMMEDVD